MSNLDYGDYEEGKASGGGGLSNGDYLFKITGWTREYRGKDGKADQPCVFVTFQAYSDLDGIPTANSSYSKAFFIYRRQGETEGQAMGRKIALGALKQLMFSVKGRELDAAEFDAMLGDPTEWINQLVGVRVAWTRRYKDPSKSELTFDRFFCADAKDGQFVMFNGNPIGEFSEARLSKRTRESLMNGSGGGGSSIAQRAYAGGSTSDDDDEIPY